MGRAKPMSAQQKQKRKKEQNKRSEIEGKFGQGKSKYGLDDIQTRLEDTSYACIGLILLALNTIKLARAFFIFIFSYCYQQWSIQMTKTATMKATARIVAYSTATQSPGWYDNNLKSAPTF